MKSRYRIRLLMLVVCGLVATWSAQAQETHNIEQLSKSVSAYTAARIDSFTETKAALEQQNSPSLKYDNSLQVGVGLPGWIYIPLLYLSTDESKIPPIDNFGYRLRNAKYYDTALRSSPVMSIGYQHNINHWLALGCKGTVALKSKARRNVVTNEVLTRYSYVVASALVDIHFSWFHRDVVSMYSSVGVGFMSLINNKYHTATFPMIDLTWIGIQVGKRVYGYAEFGGGVGGFFRGGVGVRF